MSYTDLGQLDLAELHAVTGPGQAAVSWAMHNLLLDRRTYSGYTAIQRIMNAELDGLLCALGCPVVPFWSGHRQGTEAGR
jgi:hypothetical protein